MDTATNNQVDEAPETAAGLKYLGLVKHTDRGPAVTVFQQALRLRGYTNLKVDGIYGTNTAKAVIDWQSKRPASREMDGRCGTFMWHDLTKVFPYEAGETVEEIDVNSLPDLPADFGVEEPADADA